LTKGETLRNLIGISVAGSLIIGLLVAGCGGGDSADAQQIDKATFVKEATRICKQASGKLAAEFTAVNTKEAAKPDYDYTETQIAIVKTVLVPRLEEELRQIRALGIPEEAKKEAEALLTAYQKGIERTKAKARTFIVTEGIAPYEIAELAATRLGLSECPIARVNPS
jgi:hypothetical protein